MRCGGGLFFYRGGYGGRPIALRNRAKVCVFAGAPRLGVGCEGWKRRVFDVNFQRLVNMVENDAFWPSARWSRCVDLRHVFFCFKKMPFARSVFDLVGGAMFFRVLENKSTGSPSSFMPSLFFVIPCFSPLFKRGRRKLPQAGEVRRPRRAGVVGCGW